MPDPRRPLAAACLFATLFIPAPADPGTTLRSPQIVVCGSALQQYLDDTAPTPPVNVAPDQLDEQVRDWASYSSSSDATARWSMVLFSERRAGVAFGIYDASGGATPWSLELLPSTALPGAYAIVDLKGGTGRYASFDPASVLVTSGTFTCPPGVIHHLGVYARAGDVTRDSQDARNGGHASDLTYHGSLGLVDGGVWDAFDLGGSTVGCPDFFDATLQTYPMGDLPTRNSTWGAVKTRAW